MSPSKSNRRWMQSALEAAQKSEVQMPWARGARRAAMLARRDGAQTPALAAPTRGLAAR